MDKRKWQQKCIDAQTHTYTAYLLNKQQQQQIAAIKQTKLNFVAQTISPRAASLAEIEWRGGGC